MMDIEKLIHCLQCCSRVDAHNIGCDDCGLEYCGPECQQLCGTAATALSTLQAENEKLRAELERVKWERDAARSLLAERIGVIGAEPITTAFGLPIDRLRELAQADREGKIPKYTIGDTVYDRFGDAWEVTAVELHSMRAKNEWLYRCGHNGTDDYCALWHFEAFPNKEAALRREHDG